MQFVRHEGDKIILDVVLDTPDIHAIGKATYSSGDDLFGVKAGSLSDGVYQDDGKFISSFDDYFSQLS